MCSVVVPTIQTRQVSDAVDGYLACAAEKGKEVGGGADMDSQQQPKNGCLSMCGDGFFSTTFQQILYMRYSRSSKRGNSGRSSNSSSRL